MPVPDLNADDFPQKYFWESIELMQESSNFLKCLWIEHRNRWDLSELLRISSGISSKCKIEYDIFGTVSGRILLNRPGIQYLKRTSRDIFSPRQGYQFIYADYAQFEPGILASFSKDTELIELYNKGDVYAELAKSISSDCTRKVAKEIFLSFIYGMSKENIKKRVVRKYGQLSGDAAENFFMQFSSIEAWKKQIIEVAKEAKAAKGTFGYLRKIMPDDTDTDVERWAPNHVIQSTASGIFKDALCKISTQITNSRMLVPMHDAILMECPSGDVDNVKNQIQTIMVESFKKTCDQVDIRISFEPFYEDKA